MTREGLKPSLKSMAPRISRSRPVSCFTTCATRGFSVLKSKLDRIAKAAKVEEKIRMARMAKIHFHLFGQGSG